jgi:hypothetical protein
MMQQHWKIEKEITPWKEGYKIGPQISRTIVKACAPPPSQKDKSTAEKV